MASIAASTDQLWMSCIRIICPSFALSIIDLTVFFLLLVFQSNVSTDQHTIGILAAFCTLASLIPEPYGGLKNLGLYPTAFLTNSLTPLISYLRLLLDTLSSAQWFIVWFPKSHPRASILLSNSSTGISVFLRLYPHIKNEALALYFSNASNSFPVYCPGPSSKVNAIIGLLGSIALVVSSWTVVSTWVCFWLVSTFPAVGTDFFFPKIIFPAKIMTIITPTVIAIFSYCLRTSFFLCNFFSSFFSPVVIFTSLS